jgi:hypothetical protein
MHHVTKFLNSKKRAIHVTSKGKYVALSSRGKKVYNPKVHYVKGPGGSVRVVKKSSAKIPSRIRKQVVRRPRKDPLDRLIAALR